MATNFQFHTTREVVDENAQPKQKTFGAAKEASRKVLAPLCSNNNGAQGVKKVPTKKVKTMHTHHLRPRPNREHNIMAHLQETEKILPEEAVMTIADMSLAQVEDIDEFDHQNTQMCSEYVTEIYEYISELQKQFKVDAEYMKNQTDITERMRAILIDWLVEVHLKFKLLQETMYLTVSIIDRFLERTPVARGKLQLVGVTAMLIASKYEEIYAPEVRDFVYITDSAYTRNQILQMEGTILSTLKFNFSNPLPLHFLRRNSKAAKADAAIHTLAKYLMELTLPNYSMVGYLPSEIASSALYLSLDILEAGEWNATIIHYSGYSKDMLTNCLESMKKMLMLSTGAKLQAVRKKYASSRLNFVSRIADQWVEKQ